MGLDGEGGPLLGDVERAEIKMHSVGRAPVIGVLGHGAVVIVTGVIGVIAMIVTFVLGRGPARPAENQARGDDDGRGDNTDSNSILAIACHAFDSNVF
ncbi:MAG: hypothetical protein AMXMBFR20_34580 [Planctomycetia bacterium]